MTQPPHRLMNKNFVLLWQGQFVSQLGSQAFMVAMMFWLKQVTGSASIMGLVLMASMLPMVILGPVGGAVADQVSRRKIIIFTDLVSGTTTILFAVAVFLIPDSTDVLLVLLFVIALGDGVLRAFFMPAIAAAIPSIVPQDKVATANSLNQSSTEVSTLIGQGIGGVLYRVLGAPVLFLIDGITYIISGISEMFIEIPQTLPEERVTWRDARRRMIGDLRAGLAFITERRGMRNLMIAAAVINFFSMPFFVLLPFHVEDTLGSTPDWFGYMLAGLGAGGIVGYAIAGTLRTSGRVRSVLLVSCLVGVAACMGALGVAPTVGTGLILMIVAGVFHGYFQVGIITILQLGTPEDLRGRVFGVLQTLVMGLSPIAMGLTGVAADLLDHNTRLLFTACGAVLLATALVAALNGPLRGYLAFEQEPQAEPASEL
jgi:DHA3 family macrolide efflux protein-like MFS transporter